MKFLFCILFLAIFSLAISRLSRSVEKRLERKIRKAERLFLEKTEGMSKSRLRSLGKCQKTIGTILGIFKEDFVTFCQKGANHLFNWVKNNVCPKLPCSNCCDKLANWINSKMRRRRRIFAEKRRQFIQPGCWRLYAGPNYTGKQIAACWSVKNLQNFPYLSVRVGPNTKIILNSEVNNGGRHILVERDYQDMRFFGGNFFPKSVELQSGGVGSQPQPQPQPKPQKAIFCPAIWKDLLSYAESQLC